MTFDPSREDLAAVFAVIEAARQPGHEGPYGLFDYSRYGSETPHHVRDFRLETLRHDRDNYGRCVFKSTDKEKVLAEYGRLTGEHIARAAWEAVLTAMHRDSGSGSQSEDAPKSAAEAVGPQSGDAESGASPSPSDESPNA